MIRNATTADVPQMIALAEMNRTEYETYAPIFWRKATDGAKKQTPFFQAQLSRENTLCLVSEDAGHIDGFVIASVVAAPPVYDPGSLVCMIDDFVVAQPALWATVGKKLLQEARRLAQLRGANLAVVICGHQDEPKREMLKSTGLTIASEWYVGSEWELEKVGAALDVADIATPLELEGANRASVLHQQRLKILDDVIVQLKSLLE